MSNQNCDGPLKLATKSQEAVNKKVKNGATDLSYRMFKDERKPKEK